MRTLYALAVITAACVLARPPGPTPELPHLPAQEPKMERAPLPMTRHYPADYLLPRFLIPRYMGYVDSPRLPRPVPAAPADGWLNKEIDHINHMQEDDDYHQPSVVELAREIAQDPLLLRIYIERGGNIRDTMKDIFRLKSLTSSSFTLSGPVSLAKTGLKRHSSNRQPNTDEEPNKSFAYTPLEKGYYELTPIATTQEDSAPVKVPQEGLETKTAMLVELEPPRKTRQNPNLSKTKTLVAENLDKLRLSLANKDIRIPVSLVPTNLRWLKIKTDEEESSNEQGDATDRPGHEHIHGHYLEPIADPANSIYSVALIAAIGTALAIAILGFAFGWYTLSKKAKAAADVDYPAYGVTGPTIDVSGDRKLAHSAHMYHYQHQKQQIIAMERSGLEQRNGSVSDPESEDENEEGDYTVYECPGFATTGDMEVKNPLFSNEPTPATPGKCEVVKPQPKE